jgi:hypothetical protein
MNERTRQRTIAALEKAVVDFSRPEKIRRACALRLSRLRAATKRPAATTRTTPAPAPTEDAKFEAVQAFRALAAQRSALFKKRRSAAEHQIFLTMAALMPAAVPSDNDPTAWRNFIGQIDGLLTEIKTAKTL